MVVLDLLKNLSYRGSARWLARSFGLSGTLRRIYYACVRPRDGIFRLTVGDIRVKYFVRTAGELREVDQRVQPRGEGPSLERLVRMLSPGDVVYDIGAHIGLFTVPFAKAVGAGGQVIAIEPSKDTYGRLVDNLVLNELTNVRTFSKALGERAGQAKLYLGETNTQHSLVRPTDDGGTSYEVVEIIPGDLLVEAEHLPLPRLVKIDVEGYEHLVLSGLKNTLSASKCEIVCCEVHPDLLPCGTAPETVLGSLRALGFTRIEIDSHRETFHAIGRKDAA